MVSLLKMSLIDRSTQEVGLSALELFGAPPTQTQIEGRRTVRIEALPASLNAPQLEFEIESSAEDEFIDFDDHVLRVVLEVRKADGSSLDENEDVAFVDNILDSQFAGQCITMNNTVVSQSAGGEYPVKAYIAKTLNYSCETKRTSMIGEGYYGDTENLEAKSGIIAAGAPQNKNLAARRSILLQSQLVELVGRIYDETLNLKRLVPSGIRVNIKLLRSSPRFALIWPDPEKNDDGTDKTAPKDYKILITEAQLIVPIVKISKHHLVSINKEMVHSPMKFFMNRVHLVHRVITAGRTSQMLPKIYEGVRPSRLFMCFIDHQAFNGCYWLNPYYIEHANVREILVHVNGVLQTPIRLHMGSAERQSSQYREAFLALRQALGRVHVDKPMPITETQWLNGYTIFAIDTSPDGSANADYLPLQEAGSVDVTVKFETKTPKDLEFVMLAEVPACLLVDRQRHVEPAYAIVA